MLNIFFRVANIETKNGLWYDKAGNFTGLIHQDKFSYLKNKDLPMPFDKDLVGYLSATDTLDNIWYWFPKEDIVRLQKEGWYVYIYFCAVGYKEYKNHWIIPKQYSDPVLRIVLKDDLSVENIVSVI